MMSAPGAQEPNFIDDFCANLVNAPPAPPDASRAPSTVSLPLVKSHSSIAPGISSHSSSSNFSSSVLAPKLQQQQLQAPRQQQHAPQSIPRQMKESRHVFKILVVGNASCGKTSVIRRYVKDDFDPTYISTIGADFQTKVPFLCLFKFFISLLLPL